MPELLFSVPGPTLSRFWFACARARPALESRRLPLLAALVGAVLTSPSIGAGFATEDWVQRGAIRGSHFPELRNINVFGHGGFWSPAQIVSRNQEYQRSGWFPWLTDPNFDVSFWRPLASLTHYLDYRGFPDHPFIMHVENVLWYAALAAAVAAFHARLLRPRWLAGLSGLLYAADDAHGHPVGWLINRNGLMAAFFCVLSLWTYDRYRRDRWPAGALLTPVLFLLGLASAELATCAVGYFVAHVLFIDRAPYRRRLLGAAAWVVPLVGWAIVYRKLGYTTHGSGLYIHPLEAPLEYAFELFERGAVLLMGQLAGPFSDTWTHSGPYIQGFIVFWAAMFLWIFSTLAWPVLRAVPEARFWAAGLVLSLPPACATFPEDRLLLLAGLGAFPLVAILAASFFERLRSPSALSLPAAAFAGALFAMHGFVGPALLPARSLHMRRYDSKVQAAGKSAFADTKGKPNDALFVVNGEDFYFTGMMAITRVARGEAATVRMMTLVGTLEETTIRRLDDRRLLVQPKFGFVSRVFDRIYWSRTAPFRRGSTLDRNGIDVTITEVNQWGEPTAAVFAFSFPLDSSVYHWVVWKGDRYEKFVPPPIGASTVIAG
jgi:hypothetical protein